MKNVTYLIGAGASAKAIPTSRDTTDSILTIIEEIETYEGNDSFRSKTRILSETLEWLNCKVRKYGGVDGYVSNLSLESKEKSDRWIDCEIELRKLKNVLSCYFAYWHLKKKIDLRYSPFLKKLLKINYKNFTVPNNCNFISWNYDMQIELALSELLDFNFDQIENKVLQVIPGINTPNRNIEDRFSLAKLNGSMGLAYTNAISIKRLFNHFTDLDCNNPIEFIARNYFSLQYENQEMIENLYGHSIEENFISSIAKRRGIDIARKTDTLIIIGYSFPNFNNKTDVQIISEMVNLKDVYIQDKFPDFIETAILSLLNREVSFKLKDSEVKEFIVIE